MKLIGYTEEQIRTLRVLLETTEVKGLENCKNIVMMRDITDKYQIVEVDDLKEGDHGEEVKSDRKGRGLGKPAKGE